MVEFDTVPLGEVASVRSGFAFKSSDWTESGVPVVKIANVKDGSLVMDGCSYVKESIAIQAGEFALQDGDILIAMTGYIGDVARVRERDLPAVLNQRVGLFSIRDHDRLDKRFLFYVLREKEVRQTIEGLGYGSAQPNVSPSLIHGVEVPLPPLSEQRAIARILGTLDDKIELNRRMNETLEAMARALFKSWFVDFYPVRAKAEGRWRQGESLPGLPAHLFDLFPDSFEDSELGEIPTGWRIGSVESLCESITSGGTPARMNPLFWNGGNIPWFKTGELLDGPLLESEEHISQAALDGSSCKLWPAGTILFALYASPTVGRLGVLTRPGTSNQAAAGLIAKPAIGVPFLKRLLLDARVKLQTIAVGAAQQNINQAVLKSHRAMIPTERVTSAYSRLVATADERQVVLNQESRTLAALRDTLLPKLVSGELRIPEAAHILERAT